MAHPTQDKILPSSLRDQVLLACGLVCTYVIALSIYRLYFHPLAKFPGDKLAALSVWYAGYHDLVRGGQYVWVVKEMHRKYGPVVRVRPDVLHVNDPAFIDKLYSQSSKRRERYRTVLQPMHASGSVLGTADHDLHRRRRAVLNSYFSKQNVRRLEPMINDTLSVLLRRMEEWARAGVPVQMNQPFRAATKDIIQAYAFGNGERYLEMENCNAPFFDVISPQRVCILGTYMHWLSKVMQKVPQFLMIRFVPRVVVFARWVESLMKQVEVIRNQKLDPSRRKTIFHEIMQSDIPEVEKQTPRLTQEAMVIVVAGSETTASTLCALMFHLLSDRRLLDRLKAELETVMPDQYELPEATKLDSLPFLNALIQEATRLHPGASHRQDRVAPDDDLMLETKDGTMFVIPKGSAVGMTAPIINRHPDIYDRPDEFLPDRYLNDPTLAKHSMTFSRGARQCIGINLAHQELQSLTAGIFRRYSLYDSTKTSQDGPTLELYQTKRKDIEMYSDYFTPGTYPGCQGLRIMIRS